MIRALIALCVCLSLAIVPALARAEDEGPSPQPVCSAEVDPAGDDCEADDDEAAGDEDSDEATCQRDDEEAEHGDDAGQDDFGVDDEEEAGEDGDDVAEPMARAEAAPPAPGFRDFCDAPVFDRGFLRRNWRLGGSAGGFDRGVLTVTVGAVPRVPARFRDQADRLKGLEIAVLVARRTRVTGSRAARLARRGARRVSPRTLRSARRVRVEGKLLPPSRWRRDADGLRIPTVRASRVTVVGAARR